MRKTKVTKNIFYFTDDSILKDLSNSSVLFTEVGPIIIDTFGSLRQWQVVKEFIREKGFSNPYSIIFTHGHFDHSLGTQNTKPTYPIYAHKNAIEAIRTDEENRLPGIIQGGYLPAETKVIFPNVTFEKELRIKAGNYTLRLFHTPIHSEDSITIYEEETKIAFTGDNFNEINNCVVIPNFNFSQGINEEDNEFLKILNTVKKLEPIHIIQGHGPHINPKRYFETIDNYVNTVLNFVKQSFKKGLDIDTIANSSPEDVLDKDIIHRAYDINGQYSSFKNNLVGAYNYFVDENK